MEQDQNFTRCKFVCVCVCACVRARARMRTHTHALSHTRWIPIIILGGRHNRRVYTLRNTIKEGEKRISYGNMFQIMESTIEKASSPKNDSVSYSYHFLRVFHKYSIQFWFSAIIILGIFCYLISFNFSVNTRAT